METHPIDTIIFGIPVVRDTHAARFDYDVAAIFRDIRKMQEESDRDYIPSSSSAR